MKRSLLLLAIVTALLLFNQQSADALIFTVVNSDDAGPGSLREALFNGNGYGTIVFDLPGPGPHVIDLTTALPGIGGNLEMINDRPGDEAVTIQRSYAPNTPQFRLLSIRQGRTVLISGVTLRNGNATSIPTEGGAIYNDESTLTLRNCTISDNSANSGGGIYNNTFPSSGTGNGNNATLTLIGCTLSGNASGAEGGAIYNYSFFADATVSLTNCVLVGNSSTYAGGGAISNLSSAGNATVTLNNCVLRENSAQAGGGIYNRSAGGTVNLLASNCTFTANRAPPMGGFQGDGGAIYAEYGVHISVTSSTLSGNSAIQGGAISVLHGSGFGVTLSNDTLNDNTATYAGGGIYNSEGMFVVTNCTISNNVANNRGGGIYNTGRTFSEGSVNLTNSTLAGNSATTGGSIMNDGSATTLKMANTILKSGASGANIANNFATVISLGHNLSSDSVAGDTGTGPGGLFNSVGDIRNTDPRLGPLADNGGSAQTHALLFNSPGINAGDDALAPLTDQRGYVRLGSSDIGAFEFEDIPTGVGNISTRMPVETGDNALIGGFIVTGTQPKKVIVRAIGPSLPVPGKLENPTLELHGPAGLIMSNDNWRDAPNRQEIIDSTVPPTNDLESAILTTLPANSTGYTAIVRGASGGTGVGLVEVYDLDRTVNSKLANISSRGFVQTNDDVMIGGFIVVGTGTQRVIVRAIGPSLPVPGALADPTLELRDGNGALIASNDNWRSDQEAEIIASTVPPTNDLESAIVATLPAIAHTAIVRGKNGTTGVALVEVFALP